jgi:hypothetical protein
MSTRLRNNEAVKKSREKAKGRVEALMEMVQRLNDENQVLKGLIGQQEKTIQILMDIDMKMGNPNSINYLNEMNE